MGGRRSFVLLVAASACGATIAAGLIYLGSIVYAKHINPYGGAPGVAASAIPEDCNVYGVLLHGELVSSRAAIPVSDMLLTTDGTNQLLTPNYTVSSDTEYYIENAAADPRVKAILIDINSPGGSPAGSSEIASAMKRAGKPVIAVIHEIGASAGYLVASAADRIFALEESAVGSIGVTQSYLSQYEKDKKEGIAYIQLSSGKFKDMLSPNKPLTEEERALAERDIRLLRNDFVRKVARYRNMPYEKVDALADGSTVLGVQAKELGLIDEIGGTEEARNYLTGTIGEEARLCWN